MWRVACWPALADARPPGQRTMAVVDRARSVFRWMGDSNVTPAVARRPATRPGTRCDLRRDVLHAEALLLGLVRPAASSHDARSERTQLQIGLRVLPGPPPIPLILSSNFSSMIQLEVVDQASNDGARRGCCRERRGEHEQAARRHCRDSYGLRWASYATAVPVPCQRSPP